MATSLNIIEEVKKLSNNFTQIIPRDVLGKEAPLGWGNNGVGDRWANQLFNYTVIKNKHENTYSDNDETLDYEQIKLFKTTNKGVGIIGIMVHSIKNKDNSVNRTIRKDINDYYKKQPCTLCGSNSSLVVDHKNDLYNDPRVLNTKTQTLEDFQTLCNHCNLQKRQICKKEKETGLLYSALNIPFIQPFKNEFFVVDGKFIWENAKLDTNDINCKSNSFWTDIPKHMEKIRDSYNNRFNEYKKYENGYEKIKSLEKENDELKRNMNKILIELNSLKQNKTQDIIIDDFQNLKI